MIKWLFVIILYELSPRTDSILHRELTNTADPTNFTSHARNSIRPFLFSTKFSRCRRFITANFTRFFYLRKFSNSTANAEKDSNIREIMALAKIQRERVKSMRENISGKPRSRSRQIETGEKACLTMIGKGIRKQK